MAINNFSAVALADNVEELESIISCSDCNGACCRKETAMGLTNAEAQQLKAAGTVIRLMRRSERRGQYAGNGRKFYELMTDCGNLGSDGSCQDYEIRPAVCREFKVGSKICSTMRDERDLISLMKY